MCLVELRGFHTSNPEGIGAGDHASVWGQKTIPGVDQGEQTTIEEWQAAVDVRDDYIGALGQRAFQRHFGNEFDAVGKAVGGSDLAGQFDDGGGLESVYAAGAE